LILPTAAFAAQCDPPYISTMLPVNGPVLNGTIRVQTLLFSGSQSVKVVVSVQPDGSVSLRLYYPNSDDEVDIWDGPGGVFPSAIQHICGQAWYNKWGSQFSASSSAHSSALASPRSATTTPTSGQASQSSVLADVNGGRKRNFGHPHGRSHQGHIHHSLKNKAKTDWFSFRLVWLVG
jgi:hypothetical protein